MKHGTRLLKMALGTWGDNAIDSRELPTSLRAAAEALVKANADERMTILQEEKAAAVSSVDDRYKAAVARTYDRKIETAAREEEARLDGK